LYNTSIVGEEITLNWS